MADAQGTLFAPEVWRVIPDHQDYAVSSRGRVKRLTRGRGAAQPGRLLKPIVQTQGYLTVGIGGKRPMIHRLMWETFVGPIPEGHQINHKNYDKTDNRLSNLEVVTPKGNMRHAIANGHPIGKYGDGHPRTKITDDQVREMKKRQWELARELAAEYDCSPTTVHNYLIRRHRANVEPERRAA